MFVKQCSYCWLAYRVGLSESASGLRALSVLGISGVNIEAYHSSRGDAALSDMAETDESLQGVARNEIGERGLEMFGLD